MNKDYLVRLYIMSKEMDVIIKDAIDVKLFNVTQKIDGMNGIVALYDGTISRNGLKLLMRIGVVIFPLNHYEDFIITCPNCKERIDDDMILHTYDENVLSGYNINCYKNDCGTQMANVKFIG